MKFKDKWIQFIYNFTWFSKIWYILTMKISQNLPNCKVPIFSKIENIIKVLNYGKYYKSDNVAYIFNDYLIHPRVIQCRLQNSILFGDCDDHAIYWCTALKKSKLVKKVWFSFFTMKGKWPDDTYSAHAVCVFQDFEGRNFWCDYSKPNLIEKIEDFQTKSAERYGCEPVCGAMWEVYSVLDDDTPVFREISRVLPPKK
ncbi:MAG: hypothetical protein ACK5AY_05005 [Bacteroidota bacterium]